MPLLIYVGHTSVTRRTQSSMGRRGGGAKVGGWGKEDRQNKGKGNKVGKKGVGEIKGGNASEPRGSGERKGGKGAACGQWAGGRAQQQQQQQQQNQSREYGYNWKTCDEWSWG